MRIAISFHSVIVIGLVLILFRCIELVMPRVLTVVESPHKFNCTRERVYREHLALNEGLNGTLNVCTECGVYELAQW